MYPPPTIKAMKTDPALLGPMRKPLPHASPDPAPLASRPKLLTARAWSGNGAEMPSLVHILAYMLNNLQLCICYLILHNVVHVHVYVYNHIM